MAVGPGRARVWSIGQPLLTLVLTVVAAVSVAAPPSVSTAGQASAAGPSTLAADGRSLVLPGQGTPGDLAPLVGPGYPAGDGRVVRLWSGQRERGYLLLPALGLAPGHLAGLVVVLHQDVGSAQAVAEGLGLDGLRREGIALAYPAGVAGSWNAGGCCGVARADAVDDVGFVSAVLDDVGRRVPIDPHRRALVGYSGGGMLAYRLLCGPHPALVAAVEVSGSLESACAQAVRLPDLLALHGAKDGTVGLSTPIHVTHLGMSPRPVFSTIDAITQRAACGTRSSGDAAGVHDIRWAGCLGGSTVELQIVAGAGHGWESIGGAARALPFLERHLLSTAWGRADRRAT